VGFYIDNYEEVIDFYNNIRLYKDIKFIKTSGIKVLSLPEMEFNDIMFSSLNYDLSKLNSVIGFDFCNILARQGDCFVFDILSARITHSNALHIGNDLDIFPLYSNSSTTNKGNSLMLICDKASNLEIYCDVDLGDVEIYLGDVYMYGNSCKNLNKNKYDYTYIKCIKTIKFSDVFFDCTVNGKLTKFMDKCIVHLDDKKTIETLIVPSNTIVVFLECDYYLHNKYTLVISPSVETIRVLNDNLHFINNKSVTFLISSKKLSKILIEIYNISGEDERVDAFKDYYDESNSICALLDNLGTDKFIELLNKTNIRVKLY
jgi:hypothetical protein